MSVPNLMKEKYQMIIPGTFFLRPEIRNSSEHFIFCLFYWKFHYSGAANPLEKL